jgi:hypothetical protein
MLLSFSAKESNQRNLAQRLMNTIKQLLVNKLPAAPCSMKGSALAVSVVAEQDKADLGRASLGSLDVQNQNSSHPLILKIMVQDSQQPSFGRKRAERGGLWAGRA